MHCKLGMAEIQFQKISRFIFHKHQMSGTSYINQGSSTSHKESINTLLTHYQLLMAIKENL